MQASRPPDKTPPSDCQHSFRVLPATPPMSPLSSSPYFCPQLWWKPCPLPEAMWSPRTPTVTPCLGQRTQLATRTTAHSYYNQHFTLFKTMATTSTHTETKSNTKAKQTLLCAKSIRIDLCFQSLVN